MKGKAVVDYVCVPHDQLGNCYNFRIKPCSDVIEVGKLQNLLGSRCRIPDHDILMFDYKCKIEYSEENEETHIDTKKNSHVPPRKKFKFKQIPTNFMCSDIVKKALCEIIRQIELCREKQSEIDTIYDKL